MWQYALWGLVGAAVNRALLFLEASQRVKGWPWAQPDGPGGGVYAVSVVLHLAIAATTTAAVSTTALLSSGFLAFGMGAAAPVVVKKVSGYALKVLLPDDSSHSADEGGPDDGS